MLLPTKSLCASNKLRRAAAAPLIIFALVALALMAVAGYYYISGNQKAETIDPIMASITKGEFVSQVLDQGEIQSSENVEIRCEVRARNGSLSVLSVVPEGSMVKAGDFLVQLDSTAFEKELEQQNISMANAETSVIQAGSNLASAEATKEEYIEGTFKQQVMLIQNEIYDAKSQIKVADQNLTINGDQYKYSKQLQTKGYITDQALKGDRYSLDNAGLNKKQAELALKLAEEKLRVLEDISYKKETVQLDADIKAAVVKLRSEEKAFEVEKEKLAEIKAMIEKCKIVVPEGVSGQVVYAKESSRGGNDWVLEEGTTVRQNQVLVRLPNPEKMEVKALINEQSITRIDTGMPATIKVDALNNTTLTGVVTKVNQYAESSGWMSSSIRKYAVYVKILNPPTALKPGMNSSVNIQVQYEPDVLLAPIQTIYAVGEKQYCLLRKGENEWETKEVELGGDNSQMVLVRKGVEEGTELVMNPGAFKEYMDLPELAVDSKIELPDDVKSEIGKTSGEGKGGEGKGAGSVAAGKGKGKGKDGKGKSGGGRAGGGGLPASGAAWIAASDTDGDGKISKDEAGSRYANFFQYIDRDKDGFLSEAEAEQTIQSMKKRMQGGGGGRGGGGYGGGRGGGGQ